jgi:hypothetical protein
VLLTQKLGKSSGCIWKKDFLAQSMSTIAISFEILSQRLIQETEDADKKRRTIGRDCGMAKIPEFSEPESEFRHTPDV